MKKQTIVPILFAATLTFFASCNSNQSPDQNLKGDSQRTKIISTIVKDPAYSKEIINVMMQDENCKNMMMENMMSNPSMKGMHIDRMMSMCKDDTSMCKMMMGKTMEMCDADPAKCKMMMGSMQSHPTVMKSMKGMCDMDNMKK
jgi:predicted LPLAT superfamily acyltransferase